MKKIVMFTHNDLDGYSCHAVLERFLSKCVNPYTTVTHFYSNNDINGEINKWIDYLVKEEHTDIHVIITDIGVDQNTAERLNKFYKTDIIRLNLIDHHKTNVWLNEEYGDWAKVTTMNSKVGIPECGTSLLVQWLYDTESFYTFGKELGHLYDINEKQYLQSYANYVRLYDTYTFKEWDRSNDNYKIPMSLNCLFKFYNGSSRFFELLFSPENREFEANRFCIENEELITIDKILQEKNEMTVQNATNDIRNKTFIFTINNQPKTAAVCFGLDCCNEIADRILTKYPTVDYVFIFGNESSIGIRSKAETEDCSAIAKVLGGGGHLHAAGFPDDRGFDYDSFFSDDLQILL